jgi:probable HAF family extracellular repeat protein
MWFRSLSTFFLTSQPDRFRRPCRSARRLFLEGLENRNLLTAYTITDLGSLGGGYTYAADLNEAGQVVGYSDTGTGDSRAFLWNSGTMIDLGTLGGSSSYATAVNDLGQVVGYSYLADDQVQHAFLLTPQGGEWFQDSNSDGCNDFMTDLGTPADLTSFKALHSNDAGQVAGYDLFEDPVYGGFYHAVVWEVDGSVTDLGLMQGNYDSFGEDINNAGQVVGWGGVDINNGFDILGGTRSFIWDAAGGMVRLPEISSGFQLYPYENEQALTINDGGTVLVNCYGAAYSAVQDRAFLLTPVPEGTPSISIADANTVIEGNTGTRPATFSVALSAASDQTITVAYATSDGNATAGSDYQAASGILTFAPGVTSQTITVQVIGDLVGEPFENFFVNLSSPTNAYIEEGQGIGTIVDDESLISINDVALKEGAANKTTLFTFTISLSAAAPGNVTVNYATASGTATAGTDYVSKSGTVTFLPGETSKQITISVKGDKTKEADETFFVNLSSASGGLIADGQGLGTILNDDASGGAGKKATSASAIDAAISDWLSTTSTKRKA